MIIKYNNSLLSIKKEHKLVLFSFTHFMIENYDEIIRISLSGILSYISLYCDAELRWNNSYLYLNIKDHYDIKVLDLTKHKKFHEILLSLQYNFYVN